VIVCQTYLAAFSKGHEYLHPAAVYSLYFAEKDEKTIRPPAKFDMVPMEDQPDSPYAVSGPKCDSSSYDADDTNGGLRSPQNHRQKTTRDDTKARSEEP
jgi:hypothetical protein